MIDQEKQEEPNASGVWRQQVDTQARQAAFGARQRLLLIVGCSCLFGALLTFVVSMAGAVFPDFTLAMQWMPWIGLCVGFIGSLLIALSLWRFRPAAIASGVGSALFLVTIFVASLWMARQDAGQGTKIPRAKGGVDNAAEREMVWKEQFSNWSLATNNGIEDLSPANDWQRVEIGGRPYSIEFPRAPDRVERPVDFGRLEYIETTLSLLAGQFDFQLSVFELGRETRSEDLVTHLEKEVGLGRYTKKIVRHEKVWQEMLKTDGGESWYIIFYEEFDHFVIIRVKGPSLLLPGELGQRFFDSFRFYKSGMSTPERHLVFGPEVLTRRDVMDLRQEPLSRLMDEKIAPACSKNFPGIYLTRAVGMVDGERVYYVHPDKRPMVGVRILLGESPRRGKVVVGIVPLYQRQTDVAASDGELVLLAREGYAISELKVNATDVINGVQLVYSRVNSRGFLVDDSYVSEWIGMPIRGGRSLGGTGRPVYGIWFTRDQAVHSIGLIQEF